MSQYSIQARARILARLGLPEDLGGKSAHNILWDTDNWTPEIIAAHARHIADHRQNNPYFEKTYTGAPNDPLYKGYYPEDLAKSQTKTSKTEEKTPTPASSPTVVPTAIPKSVPMGIPEGADPKKYGYFKDDGSLETDPIKIAAAMNIVYKGRKSYLPSYDENNNQESIMADTDLPSLVYTHPTSKATVDITARRGWSNRENPGYFLSKDREEGGNLYDNADFGNRISVIPKVDNVRTRYSGSEKKYNYALLSVPISTVPMKDGTPIGHLHASEWTEDLLRTYFAPRAAAVIAARHEIINSKSKGDTKNTEEEDNRIYHAGSEGYSEDQPQTSEPTTSVAAPTSEDSENSKPVIKTPRGGDVTDLPIHEPNDGEHNYANPWPTVQCAFCGDTMAGQHYRSSHAYGSVICGKAMGADPRSEWAKKVGITPTFNIDDKTTWSNEVKKRSQFYIQANGPIHPETGEPVHTGPDGLTPRNPEFSDGEQEWTREDVIKNWKDFSPSNLDYYMNKHGITEDELTSTDAGKEPILDANKTHAEPTITPPASVAPTVANNVSTQMASVTPSTNGVPFWAQGNPNWTAPKSGPIGKVAKSRATEKDWSDLQAKADAEAATPASTYTMPISYKKNTLDIYKPKAVSMTPTFDTGNGSYTMIIPKGSGVPSGLEKGWSAAKKNGRAFFVDDNNTLIDPDTGEVKGHRAYKGTSGGRYGIGTKYYSVHLGHTAEDCLDNQTS